MLTFGQRGDRLLIFLKAEGRQFDPASDHKVSLVLTWVNDPSESSALVLLSDLQEPLMTLVAARCRTRIARSWRK